MSKKKLKPKLKLVEPKPEPMPKIDDKADDELARLIKSINEMGRKAKAKTTESSKQPDPEPPIAA